MLALACRCLHSVHEDNIQASLARVTRTYSTDLRNLILYVLFECILFKIPFLLCYMLTELNLKFLYCSYLLSPSTVSRRCVTDLMPMIGARFYTQLDALQSQSDMQEDELAKEMENGRLYRLLVKLGCINERPEYDYINCVGKIDLINIIF